MPQPNVVFVFADQFRCQATGFGGDPNVHTPNLDRLAAQSLNFDHAISGCSVCCPARASLLTGQYPDRHGVIVNDVWLSDDATSLAQAFASDGYDTGYIGKWHVDGHGRSNFTPRERRQGFDFWMALECTHDYNDSRYYAGDDPTPRTWDGYDAIAQTRAAETYIRDHAAGDPFLLVLSWGPPHAPYQTAPDVYRERYSADALTLHPNVPPEAETDARRDLAGYYAHIAVLDDLIGDLLRTLDETGLADDTIFVFWSDHGDMLGSHAQIKKQKPWEESIRVPLLIRHPAQFGEEGTRITAPLNTPDLMPTLLGLAGLGVPESAQGIDYAPYLRGEAAAPAEAVLLSCYHPFGQWPRSLGGREYRGVRTPRHTYVRDLGGPWLFYDNQIDPYQLDNLAGKPEHAEMQARLDDTLNELLATYDDDFLTSEEYLARWGYEVDETGTVPFSW